MGFWSWMDDAVGCIPVVGTIKDGVEAAVAGIEGHPKEARAKLIDACIGVVCDIATVATFGAASEISVVGKAAAEAFIKNAEKGLTKDALTELFIKASVKAGQNGGKAVAIAVGAAEASQKAKLEFNDRQKRKDKKNKRRTPSPSPPSPPDSPSRKKRGDHVINLDVLKCFRKIIDDFIVQNSRFFAGLSFDQMVDAGYIPEASSIFLSHRPNTGPYDLVMAQALTTMVVHLTEPSPNDLLYGVGIVRLKMSCMNLMTRIFHNMLVHQPINQALLIQELGSLNVFIRGIFNEELNPVTNGIFVDTVALNLWLTNGGNEQTFIERRDVVREMFKRLAQIYNLAQMPFENAYLYQWVKTLYDAHIRINERLSHGNHARHLLGVSLIAQNSSKDEQKYDVSHKLKVGLQNDGAGPLYSAIAKTKWGTIPGKAKGSTCWYSYGGKEHVTSDFQWLTSIKPVILIENNGYPPVRAIVCGFQTDGAGHLYAAVANTSYGRIPGKAKDGTCWYPYGGKEYVTKDFLWLVKPTMVLPTPMITLERSLDDISYAVPFGFQNDGQVTLYCAVAHTEKGNIPGKAKDSKCWYSFGGKEYHTSDFSYLHSTVPLHQVQNVGAPPEGALMVGKQSDDAGDLFAAIANTKWGKIPGKAKEKTCWYPYGGKEYVTEDFMWVTTTKHVA